MQVIILAGGLGTRLHPVTETIPKVMVPIHNHPFLEYQFEFLKKSGFYRFLLLVSYLKEQIQDHFGDGKKFGIEIDYSVEETPMGTGGALKIAEAKLDERFILINGDTYYPLDYASFLSQIALVKRGGMIAAYDNHEVVAANNLTVDVDGHIIAYSNKDPKGMNGVDGGVSFYTKDVLKLLPAGEKKSLELDVYPILIAQKQLWAYFTSKRFYDMGTFDRLKVIREKL